MAATQRSRDQVIIRTAVAMLRARDERGNRVVSVEQVAVFIAGQAKT